MSTLANSEDPDEMQHHVAFHQALHCCISKKIYADKRIEYFLKIIACHPKICTMDYP